MLGTAAVDQLHGYFGYGFSPVDLLPGLEHFRLSIVDGLRKYRLEVVLLYLVELHIEGVVHGVQHAHHRRDQSDRDGNAHY